MDATMTVRRAERGDAGALGGLWLTFLEEQATLDDHFAPAEDALERWHNDFPFWLHDEARRLFVVEEAGQLVGFATAQRGSTPPIYKAVAEIHLDEIYVAPVARQQGLGMELLKEVRAWAAEVGAARIRLTMLAANATGQAFWRKQGAVPFTSTLTVGVADTAEAEPVEKTRGKLGF